MSFNILVLLHLLTCSTYGQHKQLYHDTMDVLSLWTAPGMSQNNAWISEYEPRCQTIPCIVVEYYPNNPISYITRSFSTSRCYNISLQYSFGFSWMEGNEILYVKYSCDSNHQNWLQYDAIENTPTSNHYDLTPTRTLYSECDNNTNVYIRFEYHGNDDPDRVYIDNVYVFAMNCVPIYHDMMNDMTLWTAPGMFQNNPWLSKYEPRCQTIPCIVIEYYPNNPISYITRSFSTSDYYSISLQYSLGFSWMEGNETLYVKYSCDSDHQNWSIYDIIEDTATSNEYDRAPERIFDPECDNNSAVYIRFEYHGNDDPDRVYIDNVKMFAFSYDVSTSHPTQTPVIESTTNPTSTPVSESTFNPTETDVPSETTSEYMDLNFLNFALFGIICFFVILCIITYIDARFIRVNDFYNFSILVTCAAEILDWMSDIFFCVDVYYTKDNQLQLLLIFIASIVFIVIPVAMTLYQLYHASQTHKCWLYDDKTRAWLIEYSALLYAAAFITGSAFSAVHLFNSNILGFDIFDMGLNKYYLLRFNSQRIYSIIIFENIPQLILQILYGFAIGFNVITVLAMIFSTISIIVTTISILTKNRIFITQDFLVITFDVLGESVLEVPNKCRNRIKTLRTKLSLILGQNERLIEAQRPYNVPNGLRVQLNISIIRAGTNEFDINKYKNILNTSTFDGRLQDIIKNAWELSDRPCITNINCKFIESKEKINKSATEKTDSLGTEGIHFISKEYSDEPIAANGTKGTVQVTMYGEVDNYNKD